MNRFEEALEYFKDQAVAWSGTKHEEKYKAAVYALKLAAKLEQESSEGMIATTYDIEISGEEYTTGVSHVADVVFKAMLNKARKEIE